MRATQKVMVAVVVVAFCAAVGATLAIPAYAQSLEKPARPSNLAASPTSSTVTLTWDNPGDSSITGYKILSRAVATESILTVLVPDTGSSSTVYIVRGLEPATAYQFAVLAVNGAGNSIPSQIVTVSTTAQTGQPTPPPDIAVLVSIIESLTDIIEGLTLKITALETEIANLKGTLGGRIVVPVTDSGDFVPIYHAATSHSNLAQKSYYEDRLFLENFTGRLTQTLALPYDIHLTMDECGEPGAAYSPYDKRIAICYELVTFLEGRLAPYYNTNEELSRGVSGFVTWVMLHELGHALIDVYDLPVTGNEEDAVDQLATVIALEYIRPDQAGNTLRSTLLAWSLGQSSIFPTEGQLAGPHSLASQRFYNVACWMYGSDVHAFSNFVNNGLLTEARAGQCQSGYERMSESWYRMVSPFLVKDDLVIRLNGASEVRLDVGDAYTEAGATCTDDRGGTLTAVRTSPAPNTNVAGTYGLTYSCMDAAGNTATITRTVIVVVPDVNNPPQITVDPQSDSIRVGDTSYDDLTTGVTCSDDHIYDIPPQVVSDGGFDSGVPGTYTITYSCTDDVNPSVSGTRTVTVERVSGSVGIDVEASHKWTDGQFQINVTGTVNAEGNFVITSTIPGEMAPITVVPRNGMITQSIITTNVTTQGSFDVTLTSANDNSITTTRSVNIPPILMLDDVTRVGDAWSGNGSFAAPLVFELRVTGSAGTSDAQTVRLQPEGSGSPINVEVDDDGRISDTVFLRDTSISGDTSFKLTVSDRGNDAESNSDRTTIPELLAIRAEVAGDGWYDADTANTDDDATIRLLITGENSTIIANYDDGNPTVDGTPVANSTMAILLVDDDGASRVLHTGEDVDDDVYLTMNADGIVGNFTVTDKTLAGQTVMLRFGVNTDNEGGVGANALHETQSPSISLPIPPLLEDPRVTTAGSSAGQWDGGEFQVRVTGTADAVLAGTSIDLQAFRPGMDDWRTVVTGTAANNLQVLPGGDIRATVPITDIEMHGSTVFRLTTAATGSPATSAASANTTSLVMPPVLTSVPTVTPSSDGWTGDPSALSLRVTGTSGLATTGGNAATLQLVVLDADGEAFSPLPNPDFTQDGSTFEDGNYNFTASLTDISLSNGVTTFKLVATIGTGDAERTTESRNATNVQIPAILTLTEVSFGGAGWTNSAAADDDHRLNLFVTGGSMTERDVLLQVSGDNGETWDYVADDTDGFAAAEIVTSAPGAIQDRRIVLYDAELAGKPVLFRLITDDGQGSTDAAVEAVSNTLPLSIPALPSATTGVDMVPMPISFPAHSGFPPITGAVIGGISEMPAVHTVQTTQSYHTLAMLTRPVANS